MSATYSLIQVHVILYLHQEQAVFSEKQQLLLNNRLPKIISLLSQKPIITATLPEHVHILMEIKPFSRVSDLLNKIKKQSTEYIQQQKWFDQTFRWSNGFAVYSNSARDLPRVYNHIAQQEHYHKKVSFKDEYRLLADENHQLFIADDMFGD